MSFKIIALVYLSFQDIRCRPLCISWSNKWVPLVLYISGEVFYFETELTIFSLWQYKCVSEHEFLKHAYLLSPYTTENIFKLNGLMEKCKQKFPTGRMCVCTAKRIWNCFSQKVIFFLMSCMSLKKRMDHKRIFCSL